MGETGDQRTLGLKVTNFGPIVEADIELRPLTVFVGQSNTGKSYLAILIYALHSLFARLLNPQRPLDFYSRRGRDQSYVSLDHTLSLEWEDRLFPWLESIRHTANPESLSEALPLPPDIAALVLQAMRNTDDVGNALQAELARCFGVRSAAGHLIRAASKGGSRITVGHRQTHGGPEASLLAHIRQEFSMRDGRSQPYSFDTSVPPQTDLYVGAHTATLAFSLALAALPRSAGLAAHETPAGTREANNLIAALRDLALMHAAGPLSHDAYYLPADRTGVMHAHGAVVGAVIDRASSVGIGDAPNVPTLSGVMTDFLGVLIMLGAEAHPAIDEVGVIAATLERDVLGGDIAAKRSELSYPTLVYRPMGLDREFSIMTSSSMVSELAPVVLYLRHYVKRGDTLIIEEPESHLHPAMQAEFALHLVRLVYAGIRVIVTTHSEWILDQFANLVRLSELSEKEREDLKGADAALSPDDIGIWLFKSNTKRRGSVVQELKVDPEAGGLLSGYDEVAEQLYNEWAEIGNRIADRGAV